jgi:hypothetical protein
MKNPVTSAGGQGRKAGKDSVSGHSAAGSCKALGRSGCWRRGGARRPWIRDASGQVCQCLLSEIRVLLAAVLFLCSLYLLYVCVAGGCSVVKSVFGCTL